MSATVRNAHDEQHGTDWRARQESWDRQQEWYTPDREERFRVMLDRVEATAGTAPRVLDLACGTGSITDRLLQRFPEARGTGLDLDPAPLTIARGSFAGDERITLVTADPLAPDWASRWKLAAADRLLAGPTAERFRIYGEHADADTPPAARHARTLLDAGFAEARTVWSSPSDAMVMALR